jgi:hypothetical protein
MRIRNRATFDHVAGSVRFQDTDQPCPHCGLPLKSFEQDTSPEDIDQPTWTQVGGFCPAGCPLMLSDFRRADTP